MTQSPCLLIVEDDEPTRTFLADNLTADGYELLVAGGVRDALRELEFHRVDLAVIDVGLPDGSGLDLVAAVRASGDAAARLDARLPIVLLSGRAAEIDRVRGFERGADDFVANPSPLETPMLSAAFWSAGKASRRSAATRTTAPCSTARRAKLA